MAPKAAPNNPPEPRWPAAIALLSAAFLPFALPRALSFGPPWVLAAVSLSLFVCIVGAQRLERHAMNQRLGYVILALLTAAMFYSLFRLVFALPAHTESAKALLQSAGVIWTTNVLVFASWYWRLDAGGPSLRDKQRAHIRGAFVFPQMVVFEPGTDGVTVAEAQEWRPGFVDYLALAFYTSTAFSPTDVPVLTRWAKLMMMMQAMISFTTVVLLAARAANIF